MDISLFFQQFEQVLTGMTGTSHMYLWALGIMVFCLIGFLFAGIEFRFAVLLIAPLVVGFGYMGWFPMWFWVFFVTIVFAYGIYIFWNYIRER